MSLFGYFIVLKSAQKVQVIQYSGLTTLYWSINCLYSLYLTVVCHEITCTVSPPLFSAITATRQAQSNIQDQLSIIQKANEQA